MSGEPEAIQEEASPSVCPFLPATKVPHNPHHITSLNNYAYHSLVLMSVFFDTRFHSLNRLTFPCCLRTSTLLFTSLLLQAQDASEKSTMYV